MKELRLAPDLSGYRLKDIKQYLIDSHDGSTLWWDDFIKWMRGQTGGVDSEGEMIVYAHDWEQWRKRGNPLD